MVHPLLRAAAGMLAIAALLVTPRVQAEEDSDSGSAIVATDVGRADQLWTVSSRHMGGGLDDQAIAESLRIRRYDAEACQWASATLDEFLASESEQQTTVIYVHGNRVDDGDAIARGRVLYELLREESQRPALRLVIWSWPASQIRGQLKDVRSKAARTDTDARFLAWFLGHATPNRPVSLLGYSLGARIVTTAVHATEAAVPRKSGGTDPNSRPQSVRVALLAAAMNTEWLDTGRRLELAPQAIEELLVLYNPCDPVLRRYAILDRCSNPTALGSTGLHAGRIAGPTHVDQWNVSRWVGKSHDELRYYGPDTLRARIRSCLIGQELPAETVTVEP